MVFVDDGVGVRVLDVGYVLLYAVVNVVLVAEVFGESVKVEEAVALLYIGIFTEFKGLVSCGGDVVVCTEPA